MGSHSLFRYCYALCPVFVLLWQPANAELPAPQYHLSADQTHNKFSRNEPPVLTVKPGAVIEVFTRDALDGQLNIDSTTADLATIRRERVHPLTGPVYVETAEPGDVLAVTLHELELQDWGFSAIIPGLGVLTEEYREPVLKTFKLDKGKHTVNFNDTITIPLQPFPGVMGVAPDTDERLSTAAPRAYGGNLDDPNIIAGTTVYFPVFVDGALFSIGDAHATQGAGEVSGTALEAPMRIVYELNLIKDGYAIEEPQYETPDYYAVTAFATTLDEAAEKAVRYMIDYLVQQHGLRNSEAYMLCSLAADLKIAEVVSPNVLVTMQISKKVLGME